MLYLCKYSWPLKWVLPVVFWGPTLPKTACKHLIAIQWRTSPWSGPFLRRLEVLTSTYSIWGPLPVLCKMHFPEKVRCSVCGNAVEIDIALAIFCCWFLEIKISSQCTKTLAYAYMYMQCGGSIFLRSCYSYLLDYTVISSKRYSIILHHRKNLDFSWRNFLGQINNKIN